MDFKILKALLIFALVCSAVFATTLQTLSSCQTHTALSNEAVCTSTDKPSKILFIGDPLPGDGWPLGGNQTGNQTG